MNKKLLLLLAGAGFTTALSAQCVTPPAPTSALATPASICSDTGGSTLLSASVTSGNFVAWYDAPSGGNFLGMTSSTGSLPVTAPSTTIFYAEELAQGGSASQTFSYTGGVQYFVVPFGTDTVTLEAWGAQGNSNASGIQGGLGGYATGKLAVTPGDTLWISVGGGGVISTSGGFNGGGTGGTSPCATAAAGGGGGASDIRYQGYTLNNRVLVAGGGGGAAGDRVSGCGRGNGGGGGGGYFGGGGGAAWPGSTPGALPTGGSPTAGGTGGVSSYATAAPGNNGMNGGAGFGGNGGIELTSNQAGSQLGAGGGNGGAVNGSSGIYVGNFTGQSGAGGSSYFGTLVNGSTTGGVRTGNGQVVISYQSFCPSSSRTPVTFIVNPLPTVTATSSPSDTVCEGTSVALAGNGAIFYNWNGPVSISDNVSFTATASAAGTYTVTGIDANNCSNSALVDLTVNALPQLILSSNTTTVCAGDAAVVSVSGANAYVWSTGGTAATETFTATASGYVSVMGTDAITGCFATDSILITVNALPSVSFTTTDSSVCIGSSSTITAAGGNNYIWSTGDTVSTITVTPTSASVYSVSVTDANGCTAADSISIGVDQLPVVTATANFTTVCAGAAVELNATGANTWLWSTGGTAALENANPTVTTTYVVTGTNSATGCSNSDSVTVTVNPLPAVSLTLSVTNVCFDDAAFTLTGGSPAGGIWSGPGVSGSTFTPAIAGNGNQAVVYSYTDANQCTGSATATVVVNACVGIVENTPAAQFVAYPNPAGEMITLNWNESTRVNRIEITDMTGRVVLTVTAVGAVSTQQVNISELPQGIYNLSLYTASGVQTKRIVKQ